jgi:hypothetical protein
VRGVGVAVGSGVVVGSGVGLGVARGSGVARAGGGALWVEWVRVTISPNIPYFVPGFNPLLCLGLRSRRI